jgi:DHA1 family bicyclomycin/chloramphenicol resistance-like MFS transporter
MSQSNETPTGTSSSFRIPGWLILLGALTALGPLSIDMYLPALPAIGQGLAAPQGTVGLTLAAFFIGMALGQLFYGPVSDRFGRKKPLYFGLTLFAVASLGCALASTITELIVWRFLQALGGCAGPVIARAIVRDRCSAHESARAFSMLTLVMGLAPILAPLLGGWLLMLMNWRLLFAVLMMFGVACLAALFLKLAETRDTRHAEPLALGNVLRGYARLACNRDFLGYTLSGGLVLAGMFAYITGSPHVFIALSGLSPQQYSIVFGINALLFIAASQFNLFLLGRFDLTVILRRALWFSPLCCAALLWLAVAGTDNWWLLWACIALYMVALGFISPNAVAAALASHGQQAGMASALMGSLQFALATLAGAAVGIWHDETGVPMAAVMMACGGGAWLAHRVLVRGEVPGTQ